MTYQHFIMIRFSIKMNRKKGFNHPIVNWDHNRLNYRFSLFENICLPSLTSQKYRKNYQVIIMISKDLPSKFQKRLKRLINQYKYIHIFIVDGIKWSSGDFLKRYCPENTRIIATTRLDDDDALSPYFTKYVAKHINNNKINDYILSFPYGNYLNIDKQSKKIGYMINSGRLIACGLTRIRCYELSGTVYSGNHKQLEKNGHKVIYDNTRDMYFVTNHDYNDSKRSYKMINLEPNKCIDVKFKMKFPFIDFNKLLI